MAASLEKAQRVLSAAINAGFRESGVHTLRNVTDKDACIMVAVRTSGLALESIIGYLEDNGDTEHICSVVSEAYLRMLLGMIRQRFDANSERILRFRKNLLEPTPQADGERWEDADARRRRKRAEGLRQSEELRSAEAANALEVQGSDLDSPDVEESNVLASVLE